MRQLKEQHIHRPVGTQVVQHGVDPVDLSGQPAVYLFEEVPPVGDGASGGGRGEGVTRSGAEGAKDVALLAATIIKLLADPTRRSRRRLLGGRRDHQALARPTLGGFRPHLVEADHGAAVWRADVQRFYRPRFAAKSGSTRSPNHVSCWRHRRPWVSNTSLRRLRFMAMPFCSLR